MLTKEVSDGDRLIENPIGFIPADVLVGAYAAWGWLLIVMALGGMAAMVVRYRRSPNVVRTQIKWVFYAGAFLALSIMLFDL